MATTTATRALHELEERAAVCEDCPLYARATQTVFGAGPADAELMLIGEQPGDKEDRSGAPFVGPAGALLDRALEEVGIDRERTYVTNAVKHFKWRRAGKVRLHQKPNREEVDACRQWWEAELEIIKPRLVVSLGATAGQAVFGPSYRVTRQRGEFVELDGGVLGTGTIHPSAILRAEDRRDEEYEGFVADLEAIAERMEH